MKLPPSWLGLSLILLHLGGLSLLVNNYERASLAVELDGPVVSDVIPDVSMDESLRDRVALTVDGDEVDRLDGLKLDPGMHRLEWSITYRGGIERRVGLTRLTGPYQSPESPHCGGRVHVSQSVLDDGERSPGTLAHLLRQRLVESLSAWEVDHLGELSHVSGLSLRFREKGGGRIVVHTGFVFEHGSVPLSVIATPRLREGELEWDTQTRARVAVSERFRSFVVDLFRLQDNINASATKLGSRKVGLLAQEMAPLLARPPNIDLTDETTLELVYCRDEDVAITDSSASIPMAVVPIEGDHGPIDLAGAEEPLAFDGDTSFAVDIDLDTINALLHALWASGYLDEVAGPELSRRFNTSKQVEQYLTVRLAELRFTLPPTVERAGAEGARLQVGAEIEAVFEDQGVRTRGLAFARVEVELGSTDDGSLELDLELVNLTLSCETEPGRLEPCYPSLIDLTRQSTRESTDPIASALADLFDRHLGSGRFESPELESVFTIRTGRVSFHPDGRSGWIRVELDLEVTGEEG